MACPKMCWVLDNRGNCLVVQDPPDADRPANAVGDAPHIVLHCSICGRIWWRWSVRDKFSRLGQRWYIVPKPKESSRGVQQHHQLDG